MPSHPTLPHIPCSKCGDLEEELKIVTNNLKSLEAQADKVAGVGGGNEDGVGGRDRKPRPGEMEGSREDGVGGKDREPRSGEMGGGF